MQGIRVAVFESRAQAEAARAALLERGFHGRQIGIGGGDARAARELAPVSSVGAPRVYALPNAPVDWRNTGGKVASQRMAEDPAQPQGELSGADDLAPQADRELLEQRRKTRR